MEQTPDRSATRIFTAYARDNGNSGNSVPYAAGMVPTFDELQRDLLDRLADTTPETAAGTIVVCPSISFPETELRKIVGIQFYEERLLFLTLLLRNPDLELVFPTSVAVDEAVIDYYLRWLPDPQDARARLHLYAVGDATPSALTDKLLARPEALAALREMIRDPADCFILPFNVSPAEARLAEALGVAVYGAHPDLVWFGSKSGARAVAEQAGVAVFDGAGDLHSVDELGAAVDKIRSVRPDAAAVVAKLNNGFSGQGNVIIEMADIRYPLNSSAAVFCASEEDWPSYTRKVEAEGAIVEELARDPGTVSPSVQLRILPGGRAEIVSTHDQILGGPDDQVYLGCRFPAREEYRGAICDAATRVAGVLASKGVIGSFGIDFVVVPDRGVFLSEINLRLGGTTHPFLMARYVTGGHYDPAAGQLIVGTEPRVYTASDNLKSPEYVGLSPRQLIAAVDEAGLAFDPVTNTGATLHLLGALPDYGKFGLLCIGRTHDEADELYERVVQCAAELSSARR